MHDLRAKTVLGRTGLDVGRLGLGSSYGVGAAGVEHAFERGVDLFYWGSARRPGFGAGVRAIAARERDRVRIVVQSYTRVARLMRRSLEGALRRLGTDHADLLLLGWWNAPPPRRIVDAAVALREAGRARHVMISCHHRPTFRELARDPAMGALMVRYNAAHPGAEEDVFPHLGPERPGVVAYTATRWGQLVDPRHTPAGEPTPRGSDCYRFALSHPSVDVCLAGPKDAAELEEALAALDRGPMDPDELAWMKRVGERVRRIPMPAGLAAAAGIADRLRG
jgi:aryl-alcohol dehydrogenase-like predicted oxidoreductase